MKKFSRVISATLLSFAIAGVGIAADTKDKSSSSSTTKSTSASGEHRYRGSVTALDSKAGTLKVKGRSDEKTFVVGDKAKTSFATVRVGDSVRLTYADEGGKLVIHSLAESKNGSTSKASK